MTSRYTLNQKFRTNPPVSGPFPAINIGNFDTHVLPNGLTVIFVENRKLPKVAFQLIINHDPIREGSHAGLADLAGELLSRGTDSRTKAQIDEAIDYVGAKLQSNRSGIFGSVLTKYQSDFLEIFQDILLNASFPIEEFNKIKTRNKSRLQTVRTEPSEMAYNLCSRVTYGETHPYSDVLTPETLENITPNACKNHIVENWRPNCSYLAVVGDFDKDSILRQLDPIISSWLPIEVTKRKYAQPELPEHTRICIVDRPGAVQSELRVVYPIDLHPSNPSRISASVMNHILGGGAFSGYLMSNLREDKGFTYGAYSTLHVDHVCAEFKAVTSVGTDVTVPAAEEIFKEMHRIRNEPVSNEHLVLAKNSMIGSFARSLENPQTLANRVLNMLRFNLPQDFYHRFADNLARITSDEIQQSANNYIFPDRAYLCIVCDYEVLQKELANSFPESSVSRFDHFGRPL